MNTIVPRNSIVEAAWLAALFFLGVVATWSLLNVQALLMLLGVGESLLLGLLWRRQAADSWQRELPHIFSERLQLAADQELSTILNQLTNSLVHTTLYHDPVYRELLLRQLESIHQQLATIGQGKIEFSSTESWRAVYEQLLCAAGTYTYRSVAHIETQHYWQDGAGRKSTSLNLELHDAEILRVERIAIIADHLWPAEDRCPVDPVREWLEQQHRYGISIELVRESELACEPELVSDFGIYGSRAVGRQILDVAGRTSQFVLSFDERDIEQAETLWKNLQVFTTNFGNLLDQMP